MPGRFGGPMAENVSRPMGERRARSARPHPVSVSPGSRDSRASLGAVSLAPAAAAARTLGRALSSSRLCCRAWPPRAPRST